MIDQSGPKKLKIPIGRIETSWLFPSVDEVWTLDFPEQAQPVYRMGLEPRTSGLFVVFHLYVNSLKCSASKA